MTCPVPNRGFGTADAEMRYCLPNLLSSRWSFRMPGEDHYSHKRVRFRTQGAEPRVPGTNARPSFVQAQRLQHAHHARLTGVIVTGGASLMDGFLVGT